MAIDMSKMKERMTALKNNGNASNKFWKPQEGEQTVRLVAPADGDPFRDYWFHYNVGEASSFLSPKRNFGEDDAIDAYVRRLWKEGSEESKRVAKKLGARQRFFAPVLVRGEEDDGVRIWGFGKRAYETLLALVLNPEYGDITDPKEGTDLVVNYIKPAGASFPETKITPRRKSSPLHKDEEKVVELMESVPSFDDLFAASRKTVEEVQTILASFLDSEDAVVDASSSTVPSGTNAVDKAFKELLA